MVAFDPRFVPQPELPVDRAGPLRPTSSQHRSDFVVAASDAPDGPRPEDGRYALFAQRLRLLDTNLKEALKGAPPTFENIVSNPQARAAQFQILELRRESQSAFDPQGTATRNFIERLKLLDADLRDALKGQAPSPENILANPDARAIRVKILETLRSVQSGFDPPGTATRNFMERLQLERADLNDALRGAAPTMQNILANPEARRAQLKLLQTMREGISAFDQGNPATSNYQARMQILQADLRDALGELPPTRENILRNPEARRAQYQILQTERESFSTFDTSAPRENRELRHSILRADLRDALNGQEPTIENSNQNAKARAIAVELLTPDREVGSRYSGAALRGA